MTDKGKRAKVEEDEGSEALDAELVMNIEKLQEVQDELEKVGLSVSSVLPFTCLSPTHASLSAVNFLVISRPTNLLAVAARFHFSVRRFAPSLWCHSTMHEL